MSVTPDTGTIDLDQTKVGEIAHTDTPIGATPTADATIYIYEGQETRIGNHITKEVVRDYLAQRFPHLAGASFIEGTRTEGDLIYRTIELAKQTYRKGATTAAIDTCVRSLPATRAPAAHSTQFLALLDAGAISLAELRDPTLSHAILIEINDAEERNRPPGFFGRGRPGRQMPLDERIARLPAIALL